MADYELKRAAQRRIDSAPELKAPPSWLEDAVASLRRGFGRGMVEGIPHPIGNIANLLRGLPEVPSEYDRRQGVMHEPVPTTLTEDVVGMVADPSNLIGGAMLKPVGRALKKTLPVVVPVVSTAYAGDTEAGPLTKTFSGIALLRKALTGQLARDMGTTSVIKEKGGNWLSGSVEGALSRLKKSVDPELEGYFRRGQNMMPHERSEVATKVPLNDWIDKQLTRYVKNEMATPQDPVRALAERGVLHFEPRDEITEGVLNRAADLRQATGNKITGIATSPLAKSWEISSDSVLEGAKASEWKTNAKPETLARIQGLEKIPDDSFIYEVGSPGLSDNLGFNHLIDELSNAINPESGLPRHLQFPADRLDRVSVPQAVERVAEINAWRKALKVEEDLKRANNAATVLHKEYPDKGMKWVELRQSKMSPEDLTAYREANRPDPNGWRPAVEPTDEEIAEDLSRQALADALKYEGDTMGHCVGGYCDDVASGRSRIYSLRDEKGQPHVTIEVSPQPRNQGQQDIPDRYIDEAMERMGIDSPEAQWGREEEIDKLAGDLWRKDNPDTQRIIQIKGKQNRAPNPEYLPFVQDFVRSGKWSDVGDLQNAGLQDLRGFADEPMAKAAREALGNYATKEEWDAFANSYVDKKAKGFASGGLVKNSLPDFNNPAIINAIFKELQHG